MYTSYLNIHIHMYKFYIFIYTYIFIYKRIVIWSLPTYELRVYGA